MEDKTPFDSTLKEILTPVSTTEDSPGKTPLAQRSAGKPESRSPVTRSSRVVDVIVRVFAVCAVLGLLIQI